MAIYASIDQGNTATKLTLRDSEGRLVERLAGKGLTAADIAVVLERHAPIAGAIYCAVRPRIEEHWQALLRECPGAIELTHDTPLPLQLHYTTPRTLGLDRIAAAAGALAAYPGRRCLVVDIGTAVTYDIAGPDAAFYGGNIAPGVGMRLRALHTYTACLPQVAVDGPMTTPGNSTETAMRCGAVYGIVGEITYYRSLLPPDSVVLLTGGRADTIAPLLPFSATVDHDLVGKGLISILHYNENT